MVIPKTMKAAVLHEFGKALTIEQVAVKLPGENQVRFQRQIPKLSFVSKIMETISESLLSDELQELYLQNRDWMSQVLFLEDESRFFQKLFVRNLFSIGQSHSEKQVELISESLQSLDKRTISLKLLVHQHQHLLETILKDPAHAVNLAAIEEHAKITGKIQELLYLDRLLKTELFMMVEGGTE